MFPHRSFLVLGFGLTRLFLLQQVGPVRFDLLLMPREDVFLVVLRQVLEPALGFEPLEDREHFLGLVLHFPLPVIDLVQRPESGFDGHSRQFDRVFGFASPASVAGLDNVDECRTVNLQSPCHFAHEVHVM